MSNIKSINELVMGTKYYILDKKKHVLTKTSFDMIKYMLVDLHQNDSIYSNSSDRKVYRFLGDNGEFVYHKSDSDAVFIE